MKRRDLLKLGAAGGAVAWAAPAIYTSRAYAAGTLSSDLCVCRDENGNITSTRKITSITIEWNAGDCTEPSAVPRCQFPDEDPQENPRCSGDSTGVASATIKSSAAPGGSSCSLQSPLFQIRKAGDPAPTDQTGATEVTVNSGEDVTIYFPAYFTNSGNTPNLAIEVSWGTGTQTICFHTSCSQSLCFEDEFGPLVVKSYTVTPAECP